MPSNHLILCCPLLLLHQGLSSESALHIRWSKYWSFSFSISLSIQYSGLISFRTDWFDLLAVQRTLKSLLQHHSSKASVLWRSAFFMLQLSHLYVTTGKTTALTIWTFVSQVMSLLCNTLCRFVMAFLPRSKRLLISWLQSPSPVILEPKKIKSATVSIVSPSICHEVMGLDPTILVFWMLNIWWVESNFSVCSSQKGRLGIFSPYSMLEYQVSQFGGILKYESIQLDFHFPYLC